MRVFIIGATGYIGSAVAQKLQADGHILAGLARSPAATHTLATRQIIPHAGDIAAIDSLVAGAALADATIYVAAADSFTTDRNAVSALLNSYRDSGKMFIFTSGSAVFADAANGEYSDQVFIETMPPTNGSMRQRVDIEQQVLNAHHQGVRTTVLRPPLVYGHGGSIQVPLLINIAQKTGVARYIGRGDNRWSTVHVADLADLYALVIVRGISGELFHAASAEVRMCDLANAVGQLLNLGSAQSWQVEEARRWGPFVAGLGSNSRINSTKARHMLAWRPDRPSVLADVEHGSYRAVYGSGSPISTPSSS